ncbi:MAG: 2'-5' RNA ligase family protein [Sulfurimonas sp.]|uniref:2'-5' RNA ligase family protein n=1 Tax=Sulfurimonas sp. TaxID=2022749 RepID=UPI0028CCC140|nr:2'-5' RNA ligase family protein [Sulfurimonas sp.]MDT8339365.1 2'-5' RNA ligase family protein [Sulfurimonas sp.]
MFLALRAHLGDYDKLKHDFKEIIEGRWTSEENLHATIYYFGNTYTVEELLEKLPPTFEKVEPLELTSLSYFSHNNILFARPEGYKLDMLHSSLCTQFSLKEATHFVPHITLMRMKKINDKEAFKELLERYENIKIGATETAVELLQSHFYPDGVKYVTVKKF